MPRQYELYLKDILKAAEKVRRYVDEVEYEVFKVDELRVDGVLHNLMIVGEAIKHIPDDIREQAPNIEWRNIGRFRDVVVHHYFNINWEIVWEIVQIHLPTLQQGIQELLDNLADDETEDE